MFRQLAEVSEQRRSTNLIYRVVLSARNSADELKTII